jgi:low temperature requirement protein LtrA
MTAAGGGLSTVDADTGAALEQEAHQPERRASWLELFFDLCFVVAVGAVATVLHGNPTREGVLVSAALFIPVWWSWMGYAWYATSFPLTGTADRLAALLAMLTVLAMAAQIGPASAGDPRGVILAFVASHGIVVFLFLRAARSFPERNAFAYSYAGGLSLAAALWLGSLLLPDGIRQGAWAAALIVDLMTPAVAVNSMQSRAFDVHHIPERYGLFTIIVLGEAIFAVARGTAESDWTPSAVSAAVAGFVIASVIWWVYFAHQETGLLERGRQAAFVWGYGHVFVWAGIAMLGVGIEFAIEAANAGHGFPTGERLILCGGFALYLAAMALLHATSVGRLTDPIALARLATALLVLGLGAVGGGLAPETLTASIAAVAVIAGVAIGLTWRRVAVPSD